MFRRKTRNPSRKVRLTLERMETRDVPSVAVDALTHPHRFAVGSAEGQPAQVSVYESGTNALLTMMTPFGREFTGGVRVATGDLTGDGIDDLVIAAGSGGPRVKVFDGATHKVIADFYAFSMTSRVGSYIAIGDVTGDGRADLVAGAGEGLRPQVKVFRGQDLTPTVGTVVTNPPAATNFFAFDANFTGGVRVAVGDVSGNGIGDIIAAPGAGATPIVKVFMTRAAWGHTPFSRHAADVTTLQVGGVNDTGGVFVAAGDLTGDGRADIAVGRMVGTKATVTVYSGASMQTKLLEGFGFTPTAPGGVPVTMKDLNSDGRVEVLAGGGTGVSQVRVLSGNGGLVRSFMAFTPTYRGGVYVG
jgi:hypothetical protein